MSECVVRMEKPKSCEDCDIATKYQRFGTEIYCPFMGWYADYDKCPIILQLPEGHGRLVDGDMPISEIEKYITIWDCNCSEYGNQTVMAVDDLGYLPIIVPADAESPSPKPTDPLPIRGVEYVPTEVNAQTGTVTYELRERSETCLD